MIGDPDPRRDLAGGLEPVDRHPTDAQRGGSVSGAENLAERASFVLDQQQPPDDAAALRPLMAKAEELKIHARPLSFVSSAFVLLHAAIPASLPRLRAMTRVGLESTTQPII